MQRGSARCFSFSAMSDVRLRRRLERRTRPGAAFIMKKGVIAVRAASRRRRASSAALAGSSYTAGREAGYRDGWQDGYRLGQCERIVQSAAVVLPVRPLHVMYVATGKGFPYSPLDEAVSATLQTLVTTVTVVQQETAAEQAAVLRPDLVLVLDGIHSKPEMADRIRALGIRTAIWFTDDPYYTDITATLALHYDDVFTLERTCVNYYRSLGCSRVYHLPLGFYPGHYRPLNAPRQVRRDISFVGSAYWNRVALFDAIAPYLAGKDVRITGIWWERLRDYAKLAPKIDLGRWMGPQETAETYNGARIVINHHRAPDDVTFNNNSARIGAVSPNPRTFEIAACATLQLIDIRSELAAYYEPGREIVTYASPEELIAKIEYYLAHEEERKAIALNGLYRTMRDHTYARRLDAMLGLLFG